MTMVNICKTFGVEILAVCYREHLKLTEKFAWIDTKATLKL